MMVACVFLNCRFLVTILVLAMGLGSAFAQPPDPMERVNCLDAERQIVRRSRADQCDGRMVSDAEAARIQKQRQAYIANALEDSKNPSIVGKRLAGLGAGLVVDFQGTVLTNAHIVKGCSDLALSSPNGMVSRAELIAIQPSRDLALLKGDVQPVSVAEFALQAATDGMDVFIIGYPNQGLPPLIPLLTEGALSQRFDHPGGALSFEAPVRPGNSGGPVLNAAGQVIGVVFAAVDTSTIYQEQGRVIRDHGIAIPNAMVRTFLTAQGVAADFKPANPAKLEPHRLLEAARDYLVRVECWK